MNGHDFNSWRPGYTLRIGVALIIAIVAGGFVAAFLYFESPPQRETVKFCAAVAAAGAAIYSAYHAGMTLRINLHRDKQRQAYQILESLNTADTVEIRVFLEKLIQEELPPATAYHKIISDPNRHGQVKLLLGILEDMSIAVQTGYADEFVLFRSYRAAVSLYLDRLKPYIDGLRGHRRNDQFYCELEKLASCWRVGKSINTNEKIDK